MYLWNLEVKWLNRLLLFLFHFCTTRLISAVNTIIGFDGVILFNQIITKFGVCFVNCEFSQGWRKTSESLSPIKKHLTGGKTTDIPIYISAWYKAGNVILILANVEGFFSDFVRSLGIRSTSHASYWNFKRLWKKKKPRLHGWIKKNDPENKRIMSWK